MSVVALGVGSNIDREKHLRCGITALQTLLSDMQCSPVYETTAVGFKGENFYNCVVAGKTTLSLPDLHREIKNIEAQYGRPESVARFASKTLDIDILLYEDLVGEFNSVNLPRKEITSAAFVLKPLADILPDQIHPVLKRSYWCLWKSLSCCEDFSEQKLWPVKFDLDAQQKGRDDRPLLSSTFLRCNSETFS